MTKILVAATVVAATLVGVASASAAPVIAGNRFIERVLKVCDNKSFCILNYSAVPAGKRLIVTDTGCVVTMPSTQSIAAISMAGRKADNSPVSHQSYIQTASFSSGGGSRRYQGQTEMAHLLLAGEKAEIVASKSAATGEFIVGCTVAGILE